MIKDKNGNTITIENKTNKELLMELYGEKEGNRINNRDVKTKEITDKALKLVDEEWRKEFPEDYKNLKPGLVPQGYAYAWRNACPPY